MKKLTAGEIKERLKKGWVRAIVVFELAGKPQAHVEETLHAYMENLKRDERLVFITEDSDETVEHEDGVFSKFIETELLIDSPETMTWLAVNFSPASIEVLEPGEIKIPASELTGWFNDLLSKLHEVSKVLREERGINSHLTSSLNTLIRNSIKSVLDAGAHSAKEIEERIGISEEQLKPFLAAMVEKEQLVKQGKKYARP